MLAEITFRIEREILLEPISAGYEYGIKSEIALNLWFESVLRHIRDATKGNREYNVERSLSYYSTLKIIFI